MPSKFQESFMFVVRSFELVKLVNCDVSIVSSDISARIEFFSLIFFYSFISIF